jgi:DNA primase
VRPQLLDGSAPEGIWDALVAQANASGFEVIRNRRGSESGYCDCSQKQISVRPDVAPAQAVNTLIHELGHAMLHSDDLPRSKEVAEVEVESVAYIVCDAIALKLRRLQLPVRHRWAEGSSDLVKETAERVIGCAKHISLGSRGSRRWRLSQVFP